MPCWRQNSATFRRSRLISAIVRRRLIGTSLPAMGPQAHDLNSDREGCLATGVRDVLQHDSAALRHQPDKETSGAPSGEEEGSLHLVGDARAAARGPPL